MVHEADLLLPENGRDIADVTVAVSGSLAVRFGGEDSCVRSTHVDVLVALSAYALNHAKVLRMTVLVDERYRLCVGVEDNVG